VFRREGFGRSRLEDVAAEVGINRASLYYYVGTKEELLVELIERPAREMTLHCREALQADLPPDGKLRQALRAYVEDLDAHPEIFLLFSESQHIATVPGTERIVANADSYGKTLTAIIEEGIESGAFRKDLDARLAMLGILGMHNWIHRWYVPGGRKTLREIGDAFAELALAGIST
jgi:AcrR family transcriptional regulator